MATYNTKYGPINYETSGVHDNWPNIVDSHPVFGKRHADAKLQFAALKALRAAEKQLGIRIAKKNGWNPKHAKARAIINTGTWRSFSLQYSLWRSDSGRYANPYYSGHVQGIAIDVNTEWEHFEDARACLSTIGWKQVRSDEPWHYTFGVSV